MSAAKAINLLSAPEAKAGPATVIMIITAAAGGTLVHEACGHGLELDLVRRRSGRRDFADSGRRPSGRDGQRREWDEARGGRDRSRADAERVRQKVLFWRVEM